MASHTATICACQRVGPWTQGGWVSAVTTLASDCRATCLPVIGLSAPAPALRTECWLPQSGLHRAHCCLALSARLLSRTRLALSLALRPCPQARAAPCVHLSDSRHVMKAALSEIALPGPSSGWGSPNAGDLQLGSRLSYLWILNRSCSFYVLTTLSLCFVSLSICSGMKRPLSPSPPAEKEPPIPGAAECPPQPPELPKPKRERKRPSYTLCDVCNIQLNSAAQAQVHCEGRAHQRRLRQLSLGKAPAGPGQCRGALCLRIWLWAPLRAGSVASLCGLFGILASEVPQMLSVFVFCFVFASGQTSWI